MAKKKKVTEDVQLENKEVIDVENIQFNAEKFEEAINEVDVTIESNIDNENIIEEINETLKPIKELNEKFNELTANQEKINECLQNEPEEAKKIIKEEIEKAEKLETEINKIINTNKKKIDNGNITRWWNGMEFDF